LLLLRAFAASDATAVLCLHRQLYFHKSCHLSVSANRFAKQRPKQLPQLGLQQVRRPSTQGRGRVKRPVTPRRASEAVLEPHSHDCNHCQPTVGKFSVKLLLSEFWVRDVIAGGNPKPASVIVARLPGVLRRVHASFEEPTPSNDLKPTFKGQYIQGFEPIGYVGKFKVSRR